MPRFIPGLCGQAQSILTHLAQWLALNQPSDIDLRPSPLGPSLSISFDTQENPGESQSLEFISFLA